MAKGNTRETPRWASLVALYIQALEQLAKRACTAAAGHERPLAVVQRTPHKSATNGEKHDLGKTGFNYP